MRYQSKNIQTKEIRIGSWEELCDLDKRLWELSPITDEEFEKISLKMQNQVLKNHTSENKFIPISSYELDRIAIEARDIFLSRYRKYNIQNEKNCDIIEEITTINDINSNIINNTLKDVEFSYKKFHYEYNEECCALCN